MSKVNPTPARRRAGFNLIEVLVAIAIFAVGFTILAAAVPSGTLLGKRTEDDITGLIAARNAVAFIEAKKIHTPGFEHSYMHDLLSEGAYRTSANAGQCVAISNDFTGIGYDNFPNDGNNIFDNEDSDTIGYAGPLPSGGWPAPPVGNPVANYCRGFWGASGAFRAAFDTNSDNHPGDGYEDYRYSDATDLPKGRIHVSHQRVGDLQRLSDNQMSYPSFVAATNERDVYIATLICDLNAHAFDRYWAAYSVALRRRTGYTWPERRYTYSDYGPRLAPQGLLSPAGITDGGGNEHPNKNWPESWGYWNSYCVTGETTDQTRPGLFNLPMIVYDWKSDLIEVSYPPIYVPGMVPTAQGGCTLDRRMATGDKFITREGGIIFTVLSTRDVGADKSYQIVQVSPSLRTTLLGPNSGGVDCNPNWRLREGFFAPRPLEGGSSPLVRIEVTSGAAGFTVNCNH